MLQVEEIEVVPQVDKVGVAREEEFNRIDAIIQQKAKEGRVKFILSGEHVWSMISDPWAKTPEERQSFWVSEIYEGTDGKNYDVMRKPTKPELELFLMLLAIQNFVND